MFPPTFMTTQFQGLTLQEKTNSNKRKGSNNETTEQQQPLQQQLVTHEKQTVQKDEEKLPMELSAVPQTHKPQHQPVDDTTKFTKDNDLSLKLDDLWSKEKSSSSNNRDNNDDDDDDSRCKKDNLYYSSISQASCATNSVFITIVAVTT